MKLLKQGRLLEIPLYFTLRRSDLAREGVDHSGSWAFADHIYRGEPSGRGAFGRWLDARLLAMPSARSFRNRYLAASEEVARFLASRGNRPVRILSAPCGIPRELVRGAHLAREQTSNVAGLNGQTVLRDVEFHGLDLDASVLQRAEAFARENNLPFFAHQGDAFTRSNYPDRVDFITCTGFGEFLEDEQLKQLYALFADVLRAGGWLVTSGMKRYWATAYLLQLAELETHYRSGPELADIVSRAGFHDINVTIDDLGLQSIVTARR
jgi:hypothetical protein